MSTRGISNGGYGYTQTVKEEFRFKIDGLRLSGVQYISYEGMIKYSAIARPPPARVGVYQRFKVKIQRNSKRRGDDVARSSMNVYEKTGTHVLKDTLLSCFKRITLNGTTPLEKAS